MEYPDNLKYTEEHEWIRVEGDVAYVGVTDHAQNELGDVVYVEIETEGEELSQNDVFGTVEAVKTVSDLYLPVSGKILEKNAELENTPELVNQSPYEDGWMIKLQITNPEELEGLLTAEAYEEFVEAS